jgi:hypothetical protein
MGAMIIGIVTGGGDCPCLNAVIRDMAKADALKRLQAETAAELDASSPPSSIKPSKENCEIA